jgi:hypothetical protein
VRVTGITDQTVTSDYATNNTTYDITITGKAISKFRVVSEPTCSGIKSSDFVGTELTHIHIQQSGTTGHSINSADLEGLPLTYLHLQTIGTSGHSINSDHLKNMSLTNLVLNSIGTTGHSINSDHLKNMSLTYLQLISIGTTGHSINSDHLKNMSLTYFYLQAIGTSGHAINTAHLTSATTFVIISIGSNNTGQISDLPNTATTIYIGDSGTGISLTSGTLKAWANCNFTFTGYSGGAGGVVDAFLNAYAPVAGTGTRTISFATAARTSASNDAVVTLRSKGKTIITSGGTEAP